VAGHGRTFDAATVATDTRKVIANRVDVNALARRRRTGTTRLGDIIKRPATDQLRRTKSHRKPLTCIRISRVGAGHKSNRTVEDGGCAVANPENPVRVNSVRHVINTRASTNETDRFALVTSPSVPPPVSPLCSVTRSIFLSTLTLTSNQNASIRSYAETRHVYPSGHDEAQTGRGKRGRPSRVPLRRTQSETSGAGSLPGSTPTQLFPHKLAPMQSQKPLHCDRKGSWRHRRVRALQSVCFQVFLCLN